MGENQIVDSGTLQKKKVLAMEPCTGVDFERRIELWS